MFAHDIVEGHRFRRRDVLDANQVWFTAYCFSNRVDDQLDSETRSRTRNASIRNDGRLVRRNAIRPRVEGLEYIRSSQHAGKLAAFQTCAEGVDRVGSRVDARFHFQPKNAAELVRMGCYAVMM